ncbi:hypothetical protein [Flavobacterium pectinovorum]|nr:hypothetical protein [Flavobacterium pectinovorum]MCI9846725.1 hypothetical protein [Flavobacterium pectinovorum]
MSKRFLEVEEIQDLAGEEQTKYFFADDEEKEEDDEEKDRGGKAQV